MAAGGCLWLHAAVPGIRILKPPYASSGTLRYLAAPLNAWYRGFGVVAMQGLVFSVRKSFHLGYVAVISGLVLASWFCFLEPL